MQSSMAMARGAPICQVPLTPGGEHSGRTGDYSVEDSKPVFKEVMEIELFAPYSLAQGFLCMPESSHVTSDVGCICPRLQE